MISLHVQMQILYETLLYEDKRLARNTTECRLTLYIFWLTELLNLIQLTRDL